MRYRWMWIAALLVAGADAQTAMFRGNPAHTGVYDTQGPANFYLKWRFLTGGKVRSSPAVAGTAIVFGSEDGQVYCLNAADGALRWKHSSGGNISSSPAVYRDSVFYMGGDGRIVALDLATGKARWTFETGEPKPWLYGKGKTQTWDYWLPSPVISGGVLYIGGLDGRVRAIDADSGRAKWEFDTGAAIRSSPAVSAGVVYAGDMDGRLYALDAATGAQKWHAETTLAGMPGGEIQSSPAVAGGMVFFGARDGYLHALDAVTGRERWRLSHEGSWINTSPAVADGVLFTGSSDGRFVQAVDAATGKEKWRASLKDRVFSSPAVAQGRVYAATHGADILALDAASGKQIGQAQTEGAVQSSPVLDAGVLYVGSDDSALYAFTERPRKLRKAIVADADALARYLGNYRFGSAGATVMLEQGQLVLDLGALGSIPLTPMSASGFFFEPADIEVEFESNAAGEISGLRFQQGEMEWRFSRQSKVPGE